MTNNIKKKRNTALIWVGVVIFIIGTMIRSGSTNDGGVAFGYTLFVVGIATILVGIFTKRKVKENK